MGSFQGKRKTPGSGQGTQSFGGIQVYQTSRRVRVPIGCRKMKVSRLGSKNMVIEKTTRTGWWLTYPSEKYEFVSWDDDIPNIWKNPLKSMFQISIKVIKAMFQTTNQGHWSLNQSTATGAPTSGSLARHPETTNFQGTCG